MQSRAVCGLSTIEKRDLHRNGENVWLLHVQPTIYDQTWRCKTPCQSIFWRKNRVVTNDPPIFAAWCCRYEYWRRQWQEKVHLVGKDVEEVLPWLGGVLHFGKPPAPRRSTPTFWAPPSGHRLKGATPVHSLASNGSKSLPCHENIAVFRRP